MTRNVMNAFTQAIGPEVTTLYARGDWARLTRLYDFSERIVFASSPSPTSEPSSSAPCS